MEPARLSQLETLEAKVNEKIIQLVIIPTEMFYILLTNYIFFETILYLIQVLHINRYLFMI